MSKYVPKDIHNAPKQGFSSPDASWFKGESIDFVERKILKKMQGSIVSWITIPLENLLKNILTGK